MRNKTFGAYLRALRVQQKMTQAQLAQQAQVSVRAICYWENDEFTPGIYEAQSVLTALGVSAQEQAQALLNLMPLRGENTVRQEAALRSSASEMPLISAGDLLMTLRFRGGLNSQEAAQQLGITPATLSRWENNRFDIPEAMLLSIQSVLHASTAEIEALRQRMAVPVEPEAPFDAERCSQWVQAFGASLYSPDSRSHDLDALALQRKLWLLAVTHPQARQASAQATLYYGTWLLSQNREKEVPRQAKRALNLYVEDTSQANSIASALNLLSWCKTFRVQPTPEQGERFLRPWLSRLQHPAARMNLLSDLGLYALSDLGLYASMSHKSDVALRYLGEARKIYAKSGKAAEALLQYQQLTYARVLLYGGKPLEAYEALTRIIPATKEAQETVPVAFSLLFVEIMLAAKERSLAETWLYSVYARLQIVELPRLRMKADALAWQL